MLSNKALLYLIVICIVIGGSVGYRLYPVWHTPPNRYPTHDTLTVIQPETLHVTNIITHYDTVAVPGKVPILLERSSMDSVFDIPMQVTLRHNGRDTIYQPTGKTQLYVDYYGNRFQNVSLFSYPLEIQIQDTTEVSAPTTIESVPFFRGLYAGGDLSKPWGSGPYRTSLEAGLSLQTRQLQLDIVPLYRDDITKEWMRKINLRWYILN